MNLRNREKQALLIIPFFVALPACDTDEFDRNPSFSEDEVDLASPPTPSQSQNPAYLSGPSDLFSNDETEPSAAGKRSCTKQIDCRESCKCTQGKCEVGPFGPLPPADYCDQAPVRACDANVDCQTGCVCDADVCKPNGFSPSNPTCHRPPPDAYEEDNVWQDWTAYTAPQEHNFHIAADADWVAVYFASSGSVRFWTTSLWAGTDTKLEVYPYTTGLGPLVKSHDDIGGDPQNPNSKSSRIDLNVPAKSNYFVKVINKTPASFYDNNYYLPAYTLKIAYN